MFHKSESRMRHARNNTSETVVSDRKSPQNQDLGCFSGLPFRVPEWFTRYAFAASPEAASSVPSNPAGCKGGMVENTGKSCDFLRLALWTMSLPDQTRFAVVAGVWWESTGSEISPEHVDRWRRISRPVREGIVQTFTDRNRAWFSALCDAVARRSRS